jgi:2-methylcitrate dehydratase PrpD
VSATGHTVHPTADLIAFAANGWAFRDAVRAPARELVLATLLRAMANATSAAVEIAATGSPAPARMRARAIGRPAYTTPLQAAFLTALAAGDDPALATPVVAAAFALGESTDAPGATVLDAIVAGTEIAVRVEAALGAAHRARGWDTRGTCGRLGAAVAAARVLGLQRDAMRDAFGIAATATGGLSEAHGTMAWSYIAGLAAADGIEAALLARAEFTGAPLALEGRRGLAALMSSSFDAEALVAGLGQTFAFAHAVAVAPTDARTPATEEVRERAARIERLPSIRELIDVTIG